LEVAAPEEALEPALDVALTLFFVLGRRWDVLAGDIAYCLQFK
jgi:hypothetical protein